MKTRPMLIIAEAGVNHNGNSDLAFNMVDAAAEAGVNAIKFQTFDTDKLVTRTAPKADYQKNSRDLSESQYSMLSKLELDHSIFRDLKRYSETKGLMFMSTAFDLDSLRFLQEDLQLNLYKIPSGEITNGPLLLRYAEVNRKLILSTGMSTIDEIEKALGVLAFGLLRMSNPTTDMFTKAYRSNEGKEILKEKVALLHCTTEYPTADVDVNLKAIGTLRDIFGLKVGYSDHTLGLLAPCVAAALGAEIYEKHFTLDKTAMGPDHSASLDSHELKEMVKLIRSVEAMLGSGVKIPTAGEFQNKLAARKSITASDTIEKGSIFTVENIATKRPEGGRSPMEYWDLLGQVSNRSYCADDQIE